MEYHASQTLFLEGSDFVRRKFSAILMVKKSPLSTPKLKGVEVSSESPPEVDDEEAEEAVEIVLNELDHWDGHQGRKASLSGN